eukprot:GILJ01001325.1.p1 GENE.GILJ01001325.1~~GILJ01001325.1.p1  ORF type:complete len:393 (+),score=76.09 GILJ01001325.1:54-1232(+)
MFQQPDLYIRKESTDGGDIFNSLGITGFESPSTFLSVNADGNDGRYITPTVAFSPQGGQDIQGFLNTYQYQGLEHSLLQRSANMSAASSSASSPMNYSPTMNPLKRPGEMEEPKVDKKLKRMERNRENSRESRKRQKAYVQGLEEKIQKLEAENAFLRLQMQQMTSSNKVSWSERELEDKKSSMHRMVNIIKNPPSDKELAEMADKFVDRFSSYGPDRKSQALYHFDQLRALVDPTGSEKIVIWGMQQSDAFFDETNMSSSGIYGLISKDIGITEDQKNKLKKRRPHMRAAMQDFSVSYQMLTEMHKRLSNHMATFKQEAETIRKIFSPMQQLKFFLLMEENLPIVSLINSVWNQTHIQAASALPDPQLQADASDKGSASPIGKLPSFSFAQ